MSAAARRRSFRGAVAVAAGSLLLTLVMVPKPAVAEPPGAPAESRGLLDEAAAVALADAEDREVEVSELTSEWRRVVATPEGTLRGDYTVGVARVRDGQGGWRDPDSTLEAGPDGSLRPVAARVPITVSAGGTEALASMESGAQQLAMSWRGTLPVPSVEGDTATYANVYPDVDLVVRVGADSLATYLVVKTAAASLHEGVRRVVFDVETLGVPQVQADQAGGFAYKSSAGEPAFGVSVATMWDAAGAEVGAESSELIEPSAEAQVRKMGLSASSSELVVVPDAGFLDDPATVYPVTIDPVTYAHGSTLSQRVTQTFTQTNHTGDAARVGYNGWTSPYYQSEMYYRFAIGIVEAPRVKTMVFRHDNVHSVQHSPCYNANYGNPIEVGITGWADANTTWSTRPGWLAWPVANGYAVGHENYCNARATVAWDLKGPFQSIFGSGTFTGGELTIGMRGAGATNKYTWREFFNQFNAGSASRPLLTIEYMPKPDMAQSLMVDSVTMFNQTTVFTSLTPKLRAVLPTTHACASGPCQRAVFEIRDPLTNAWVWWGLSNVAGPGATVEATVPLKWPDPNAATTTLKHDIAYKVVVFVENTEDWQRSDLLQMGKRLQVWTDQPAAPTVLSLGVDQFGNRQVKVSTSTPFVSRYCWAVANPAPNWYASPTPGICQESSAGEVTVTPLPPGSDSYVNMQFAVQYTTGEWKSKDARVWR